MALSLSVAFTAAHAADIVDTAKSAGSFNTLVTAVQAAGLAGLCEDPERQTRRIVERQSRPDQGADLPRGIRQGHGYRRQGLQGQSVAGSNLTVKTSGSKVMVDKANVVKTDIAADNGVIHVIDTVLMPK